MITRRRIVLLVGLAIVGLVGLFAWRRGYIGRVQGNVRAFYQRVITTEDCLEGPKGIVVCVTSEMARLPNHGPVPESPWLFDAGTRTVRLAAARNEVVAFQVVLKARGVSPKVQAAVRVGDLTSTSGAHRIPGKQVRRFLAHYVWVENAGYTWGPKSKVLPWPDFYPDALVPFESACHLTVDGGLVPPQKVISTFPLPPDSGPNQAVWFDLYVPRTQPPGLYRGPLSLVAGGESVELKLQVQVHPVTLPDSTTVDAVGELYDPYRDEGVGMDVSSAEWQRMAHCYHQLAHRHRTVFVERLDSVEGVNPTGEDGWEAYDRAFGPVLTGELFTPARGYVGPGQGVGVSVWRTPWPQTYNERLEGPLDLESVERYEQLAKAFADHARSQGWNKTYMFAYLFDEVDGPTDDDVASGRLTPEEKSYIRMVHEQMARVQQALDRGSGSLPIHLLWTSHADATRWRGLPGLDLVGTIRLWAPTASAAPPGFLRQRLRAGERTWFYHSGHPAIGVHVINASGVEMRTWGVVTARYGLSGHLLWAVNFCVPSAPFAKPSYKPGEDRFGNGTVLYPGRALPKIGFPALAEPVPSMRLKAWRRGLQDAELVRLARAAGKGSEVQRLLKRMVPAALADGRGDAAWSTSLSEWHQFHDQLLRLAHPSR